MEPDVAAAYDTVAEDYAVLLRSWEGSIRREEEALAGFAAALGPGPVADVGSGTGRLTGPLRALGLAVVSVDLSPGMLAVARRDHPDVPAVVGSLAHLPLADGGLAGALAWYSTIHTPTERLPHLFGELRRALRPGGLLLVGFQVGDEVRGGRRHLYGHDVVLDSYRRPPDVVAAAATAAGLVEVARTVRAPEPPEDCAQAHLLLRR